MDAMPFRSSFLNPDDTATDKIMMKEAMAMVTTAILPWNRSLCDMKDDAFTTRCGLFRFQVCT